MLVDTLLLGGPEDGAVRQVDPHQEDGYTVVDAKTDDRHEYLLEVIGASNTNFYVAVYVPLLEDTKDPLDIALELLVRRYVESSKAKVLV